VHLVDFIIEMAWACDAYGLGKGLFGVLMGNRMEKDHRGNLRVDGWIILGRIFRTWGVGIWTVFACLRIETVGGRL